MDGFLAIVVATRSVLRTLRGGGCVGLKPDPKDADWTGGTRSTHRCNLRIGTARSATARPPRILRCEPLPWAKFFVRYGRAVGAIGRRRPGHERTCKLADLLAEAERLGIGPALDT
jgi:hypothetical protein